MLCVGMHALPFISPGMIPAMNNHAHTPLECDPFLFLSLRFSTGLLQQLVARLAFQEHNDLVIGNALCEIYMK